MLSVVIPVYNEERYIADCLESLVRQRTKQKFEVIVVDNNSTDNTVQIVQKYKNKLDLKIVSERKKGRGVARNTGFKSAKGDIILGTEADAIVPDTWIDKISGKFIDNEIIAVTGTCEFYNCMLIIKMFMNKFQPFGMSLYKRIFGYYWLSGFNFAIRSTAYIQSGGFDPELNTYDDIEIGKKVDSIGAVRFINNYPVLVSGRRFKRGLFRGLYSYFKPFIEYSIFHKKSIYLDDQR